MRILICEDDPIHSMALEMTMEEAGHEVVGLLGRADEALLRCWRDPPDLALVDLNLADGATGSDLVRALDRMGIACVVISGDAEGLGRDAPARAVVPKPFRDRQLLAAVRAAEAA